MMFTIFFSVLAIIFCILVTCILKSKTLWDKILASNLCSTIAAMAIMLYALYTGIAFYVDVALVFVLVGFVGTQFYATFISRFGRF